MPIDNSYSIVSILDLLFGASFRDLVIYIYVFKHAYMICLLDRLIVGLTSAACVALNTKL